MTWFCKQHSRFFFSTLLPLVNLYPDFYFACGVWLLWSNMSCHLSYVFIAPNNDSSFSGKMESLQIFAERLTFSKFWVILVWLSSSKWAEWWEVFPCLLWHVCCGFLVVVQAVSLRDFLKDNQSKQLSLSPY